MNELVMVVDGNIIVNSRQVASRFGKRHDHVLESIREILATEISGAKLFHESTYENRGKQYPEYIMNRDGFSLLTMGFQGAEALKWKLKYIQAFNDMEIELNNKVPLVSQIETDMIIFKYANESLRASEASRIRMLTTICKNHGTNPNFLPQYTDEQITKSAKELLKQFGSAMSTIALNKKLLAIGILEEKERQGKSGIKKFKSLTEKGLRYGKNIISPMDERQTAPHYFENLFGELIGLAN